MNTDVRIRVQPTPNPNALKFITNQTVKTHGKATFVARDKAQSVRLAAELFELPGVSQLHFFDNFITVTFNDEIDPSRLEAEIESILMTRLPVHNPDFELEETERLRTPRQVTPELQAIDEILDRTVRPGLRADGGDIEALSLDGNTLRVNYQGACGTCPSATMGTLEAIQSILAAEFNPDIQVEIA